MTFINWQHELFWLCDLCSWAAKYSSTLYNTLFGLNKLVCAYVTSPFFHISLQLKQSCLSWKLQKFFIQVKFCETVNFHLYIFFAKFANSLANRRSPCITFYAAFISILNHPNKGEEKRVQTVVLYATIIKLHKYNISHLKEAELRGFDAKNIRILEAIHQKLREKLRQEKRWNRARTIQNSIWLRIQRLLTNICCQNTALFVTEEDV